MNVEADLAPNVALESEKAEDEPDCDGEGWLEQAESAAEIQADWDRPDS
jgi:hypothetical protein